MQMTFPTKTCFACGKDACNGSCHLKMVEYPGGHPAELDVSRNRHGTGVWLQTVCFCAECDKVEPLAKVLRQIKALDAELVEAFAEYRSQQHKLADRAERMMA